MTVYGRNSVEEALSEGIPLVQITVEEGKASKFSRIIDIARKSHIPLNFAHPKVLEKTAKTRKHQGITAEMRLPENIVEQSDLDISWDKFNTMLALDGITDTGNLGAIIRSALLFDIDAIVLPNDNSARITPAVIKSSAGAIYKQNIFYINNLNTFILEMKSLGFTVAGLAGEGTSDIRQCEFSGKVCLVIGSEREGLRKSVKRNCDMLINIPTTRRIDSLNASVASAVAMWEVFRRK
jgi:23S rRNA (guanosine2251-2'-O)-methyltransferase